MLVIQFLKIVKCLKNKHDEKLLKTYHSERNTNVKEYVETTMRMGEFVNAAESIEITDNISSGSDGTKSMQSIKPALGKGLGNNNDVNTKNDDNKNTDDKIMFSSYIFFFRVHIVFFFSKFHKKLKPVILAENCKFFIFIL